MKSGKLNRLQFHSKLVFQTIRHENDFCTKINDEINKKKLQDKSDKQKLDKPRMFI